jgi:hypothetical protein
MAGGEIGVVTDDREARLSALSWTAADAHPAA